jgi:hypothetical protein
MQVIGQHHPGQDIERMRQFYLAYRVAQVFNVIDRQCAVTLGQIDRKEIGAA